MSLKQFIKRIFGDEELETPVEKPKIGIALFTTYTSCMGMGTGFYHPTIEPLGGPGFGARDFFEFTEDDLTENRSTELKVKGTWFKHNEVLLYQDIKNESTKQVYINKMAKKYGIRTFTDIHKLYDHGLTVTTGICRTQNHFHDKKLERKINRDMEDIINER